MSLFLRFVLLAVLGSNLVSYALAAFASCQTGWEWANNTLNQNPCEIAGALEASCQGFSVYVLGPLTPGSNYVAPQKNSTGAKCECNTVMYSLYMACTGCQNLTVQTWAFWEQYCDQVYVTQLPYNIPPGTAVPHWAYLNVTGGSFDSVLAKNSGDSPESSAQAPPVATIPSTTSVTSSSGNSSPSTSHAPSPSTSATNTSPPSKSSSSTGAIAGGVTGGVVVLVIIAGFIFFYRRRRNATITSYPYEPSPVSHISSQQMRLYDPSDPSTFPQKESTVPSASDISQPMTTMDTSRRGQYTGVPEV